MTGQRTISEFARLTTKEASGFSHIEKEDIPYHAILEWIEKHPNLNQAQVENAFFETAQMIVPQSQADLDLTSAFQTYLQDLERKGADAKPRNAGAHNNGFSLGISVRKDPSHDCFKSTVASALAYSQRLNHTELSGSIFDNYVLSLDSIVRQAAYGAIAVKDLAAHVPTC